MTTFTPSQLTAQLVQMNDFNRNGLIEFVLKYGKEFTGRALPSHGKGLFKRGKVSHCYSNTYEFCRRYPEYTYHEGYGIRPELGLHIMHAWAVGPEGEVIDRTWENPQDCVYVGVPFELVFVGRHMLQVDSYGILGNHWMVDGCPLFTSEPVFDDDDRICDYGES